MKGVIRRGGMAVRVGALVGLALTMPSGCGMLDVSDPTAVEESDLRDATGAQLLRENALQTLADVVQTGARFSGLLADEFLCCRGRPPRADDWLNRRASERFEALATGALGSVDGGYAKTQGLRTEASVALGQLHAYASSAARPHIGEMYGVRAYATLRLGEDFCPGLPLREVVAFRAVHGPPLSTEAVLERALVDYDSALSFVGDSARIRHFVQVGRARALLQLGRFSEAASATLGVPTAYADSVEYRDGVPSTNFLAVVSGSWGANTSRRYSVADREGGNGLNFVSAADPRAKTTPLGRAPDGTQLYGITKYPTTNTSIVLASGIEARLIEAEAALRTDPNGPQWLAILNTLRTGGQDANGDWTPGTGGVAGLSPLSDPANAAARLDLVFRERAFWLFATGTRLGDLRRLVRVYARATESVFPTGSYPAGGAYETATSIPFPAHLETPHNSAITGCTSR